MSLHPCCALLILPHLSIFLPYLFILMPPAPVAFAMALPQSFDKGSISVPIPDGSKHSIWHRAMRILFMKLTVLPVLEVEPPVPHWPKKCRIAMHHQASGRIFPLCALYLMPKTQRVPLPRHAPCHNSSFLTPDALLSQVQRILS